MTLRLVGTVTLGLALVLAACGGETSLCPGMPSGARRR